MIAGLKPYPVYKDSGVPWLGEVPEHWEVRRAKFLMREVDERSTTGEEELLSVSHKTGVTSRRQKSVTMFFAESNVGHKVCRPGDVVVNTMWAWMAALGVSGQTGIVSPSYGVYRLRRPDQLLQSFLDELLRTRVYRSEYVIRSTGITDSRLRLYPDAFLAIPMLRPEIAEQYGIIRFLDHTDRRIRRYIRAKQKLVALLNEQKQAIIHRAVTRGLPSTGSGQATPSVRLKPSGVAGLGDVPEHWEVSRFKVVLSRPVRNGLFKKKEAFGSGVPLVNVADVYRDNFRIEPSSLDRVQATPEEVRTYQVRPGDLFFVRSSLKLEGTGRSAIAIDCEPDTVFECHLVQGRPHPARANARFLAVQLNSFGLRHYLISRANVVTMATVAQDVIATCPVWLPSLSEQAKVLERLERENERLDGAIDRANREISLLREYRTRLIADVVTGKLDVREEAARLPEEAEGPELLDEAVQKDEDKDLEAPPEEVEA